MVYPALNRRKVGTNTKQNSNGTFRIKLYVPLLNQKSHRKPYTMNLSYRYKIILQLDVLNLYILLSENVHMKGFRVADVGKD